MSRTVIDNTTFSTTYSPPGGDIVDAGCIFRTFDVVACARCISITVVVLLTGALCVLRIVRLHTARHQSSHHYLIFYSAMVSCVLCAVHWILGRYAQLDFLAQWFKQMTYLVVTHFFWSRAYRAIRREKLTNCCLLPCLVLAVIYCTAINIVGMIQIDNYINPCRAVFWVLLSSAELFLAFMFLVASTFISRRLDMISTVQSVRRQQKCHLWTLAWVFQATAFIGFGYDITMLTLGRDENGCGEIFDNNQLLYSIVFGFFMIVKFAFPVWAMLAILQPIPASPTADETSDEENDQEANERTPILSPRSVLPHPSGSSVETYTSSALTLPINSSSRLPTSASSRQLARARQLSAIEEYLGSSSSPQQLENRVG